LVKVSVNRAVARRIFRLRKTVEVNTQKIRSEVLRSLEEVFNLAVSIAKGEVKRQRESNGKEVPITLKQRQMWARVAAYTAQIMNSIAEGFDEREIDAQLDELERLVNEARSKAKAGETQEGAAETGTTGAAQGQN